MAQALMFDSTPLGRLARRRPDRNDVLRFERLVESNARLLIPEIVDFEVRRSLILHNLSDSLEQLDFLKDRLVYVPLTTSVILAAADLWAQARKTGHPTADPKELDCDVILAAQAIDEAAEIITENVGHLAQFVAVRHWSRLPT